MTNKNLSSLVSHEGNEKITSYTDSLIANATTLRDKYFDPTNKLSYRVLRTLEDGKEVTFREVMARFCNNQKTIEEAKAITSTPRAKEIFTEFEPYILDMFNHLADLMNHPSRNDAAGHDSVHATYDTFEVLDYMEWLDDPVEKTAAYLWSLVHDAGRTDEIMYKWGQVLDDSHAYFSILYLIQEFRNTKEKFISEQKHLTKEELDEVKKIANAYFTRVINAVIMHPGFNDLRDPAFHHVQSLDRLAGIFWQRIFVRMFFADGLHHNHPIMPDNNVDGSEKLPNVFNVHGNYSIFHKLEAFTRGTFHKPVGLSLESGNAKADEQMRTGLAVLMLLSWWYDTPLFKQTFNPELKNATKEEYNHKDKKGVLPDNFKKMIQEQTLLTDQEKAGMLALSQKKYTTEQLFWIIFKQQAMFLSKEDTKKFFEYFNTTRLVEWKDNEYNNMDNLIQALQYIIIRRELDRVHEKSIIIKNIDNENDQYKASIANKIISHPLWNRSLENILAEVK